MWWEGAGFGPQGFHGLEVFWLLVFTNSSDRVLGWSLHPGFGFRPQGEGPTIMGLAALKCRGRDLCLSSACLGN